MVPQDMQTGKAICPGHGPETKNVPVIKQLLDRIEKLEARVAQLEKRLAVVSKGWKRKEFNGQYYYIVPLDSPGRPRTPHAR